MSTGNIPLNPVIPDQLITSALWNAEFANIQTLTAPEGIEGYMDTDPESQIQTAPYPGSVLSKATSLAGEIERIRYQLAKILGTDFWYKPQATDLTSVGNVVVPLGGVIDYPVVTAPNANWHLADGTAISRAGFPGLFTLIGTTFGVGDGATTFNLPDYRDRMSIGAGNLYAAAATGGEATHVLTIPEMPAHNHPITDPGHTHTITDPNHSHGITDPTHTHTENYAPNSGGSTSITGTGSKSTAATLSAGISTAAGSTGVTVNSGSTGITGANSNTTGITDGNTGGGGAHNNLPPYLAMYKMIRVL